MVDRLHGSAAIRFARVWDLLCRAIEERCAATGRAGTGEGLDILDAGGGTGRLAVPLAALGHTVTVVDPSPDALAALARRAAEGGVRDQVRGVQGDLEGLLDVVPPASADMVLCHGVLEAVEDPSVALAGAARCLRPDGVLSLLLANRHAAVLSRAVSGHFAEARSALTNPTGRWGDGDPVPRRFSSVDADVLLAGVGLRILALHGVRIFTDLVPGALLDSEPGRAEALLDLEAAAAEHPAFREIATQLHVLAAAS